MFIAIVLLAASASADPRASSERTRRILLAVNEEATSAAEQAEARPPAGESKIEHAPLLTTPRNQTVVIQAKVLDPSKLFAPLVFARKSGIARYEAFTMRDRGPGRAFQARLPSSILSEGSFEYFIEAQHEQGPERPLGEDARRRSEEHTSELQSPCNLVCRLLLEKKKKNNTTSRLAIRYER